jgi:hypothetical protein
MEIKCYNFSHPISENAQAMIQKILEKRQGSFVELTIVDIPNVQFKMDLPLLPQLIALLEPLSLTPRDVGSFVVRLPGLEVAAVGIVTIIARMTNMMPPIVTFRRLPDNSFVPNEIIWLDDQFAY